jgi:manganese transport protein
LLFVVLLASLAGMVAQSLAMRLGIATGKDLARLTRQQYGRQASRFHWMLAEISMIATDLADDRTVLSTDE